VISPAEASAKVGDTIEWVNKDIFAHTATARNGDWDVTMPPKKTVTLVLKKARHGRILLPLPSQHEATFVVAP
jgi:plastocyanin